LKKFIVTFEIIGSVSIKAKNEDEARAKFDKLSLCDLYDEATSSEITGVFEE